MKSGATNRALITFTFNTVSQGLYIRNGLFPTEVMTVNLIATSWLPANWNIGYFAVADEQNTCLLTIKTKGRS